MSKKLCGKSLNAGAILTREFEEWESGEKKTGRQGDGATGGRRGRFPSHSPRRPVASSLLGRVIPRSGARDVIGLLDSDVEFAESAVALFVGRVESEDVLGAQPFGEIGEGPVEFFQRRLIGLFAKPPPVGEPGFEQFAACLFSQ